MIIELSKEALWILPPFNGVLPIVILFIVLAPKDYYFSCPDI